MAPSEVAPLDSKQPECAQQILALHAVAYAQEAKLASVPSLPPMERSIAELQATHESFFGVLLQGELAAAISIGWPSNSQVEICSLAVHPKFQRLGLGRTMLRSVVAKARGRSVLVSTAAANLPALALYKSEGFAECKRSMVSSPQVEVVLLHRQSPNPSVKGTSTSGLRPLVIAPYLER
jgi:ribosomal protein S18 acetylase RimI-like enzyme